MDAITQKPDFLLTLVYLFDAICFLSFIHVILYIGGFYEFLKRQYSNFKKIISFF